MERIEVGNNVVWVCNNNELPEPFGLTEGAAFSAEGENEAVLDLLAKKFRRVESGAEDEQFCVTFLDKPRTDWRGKEKKNRLYALQSVGFLSELLSVVKEDAVEVVVFTDLLRCESEDLASAYGGVVSQLARVCEYRIHGAIHGGFDEGLVGRLRKIAVKCFSRTASKEWLIAAQLSALRIIETEGLLGLCCGYEQTAEAWRLLIYHEKGESVARGLAELISAVVTVGVYKSYLTVDFGFVAPPDNNLRLEQASELTGIAESEIAPLIKRAESEENLRKISHALKQNKGEILAELVFAERILVRAVVRAKKMLPDCGYGLKRVIDKSELRIAFALAPDLSCESGSLVGIMKSVGALDFML